MPELPEVETVTRELSSKLTGLAVSGFDVFYSKNIITEKGSLDPRRSSEEGVSEVFKNSLIGRSILGVSRRGRLIIIKFNEVDLVVHLKMTGQLIFEDILLRQKTQGMYKILNKAESPLVKLPSKYTIAVFYFDNGSRLYFSDVRRFGYIRLVRAGGVVELPEYKLLGPEPLRDDFAFEIFKNNLQKRKKTDIKTAIMDNRVVVGIGNIYSDEILFHSKVLPYRKVFELNEGEILAIYNNIKPVLQKGIETGGSSVGDFIRTDGSVGEMGKHHYVYGRKKQVCMVCGAILVSQKLSGRTSTFCGQCQK